MFITSARSSGSPESNDALISGEGNRFYLGPFPRLLFIDHVTVRVSVETGSALSQDGVDIRLPSVELRGLLRIVLVKLVQRTHSRHCEN